MNPNLLFIDFETAWESKKDGYGLKQMSMVEYVRSEKFKAFGFAFQEDSDIPPNKPAKWISGQNAKAWFDDNTFENLVIVGHNIKFDGFILTEKYGIKPKAWIDTKAMSKAVLGKTIIGHSLKDLATHFNLPPKGEMKTDGLRELTAEQEAGLATYCKQDVFLTREIYKRLAPSFPENQYKSMSQTIDMFVNPKLQLNVEVLENAAKEEAKRREAIFKEIGIDKKEFASNVRFPVLLTERGHRVPYKPSPRKVDENGKPILIPALALGDVEFLEMLEGDNEELVSLCEARVAAKSNLLETRSTKLASIARTGRWPFDVEFSGADQTHRFSGGGGAGGNPQNFTRDSALRKAVEAPEGYKLVVGDFSNIEMRLVAYLSKDPGLIQAIEKNSDVYCEFASSFYGRRITKENKEERRFGKTAILGLGYGMGWKKFIKTVRTQTKQTISEEESKKAIALYRSLYANVPKLWEMLDRYIINLTKDGVATHLGSLPVVLNYHQFNLPSSLAVRFPKLGQVKGERGRVEWTYQVYKKRHLEQSKLYGGKLLENICQGLAGELCKEAMNKMGDHVAGQVHDELILCVPEDEAYLAAETLEHVMSQSPLWMPNLWLAAEVKIGRNWGECK